MGSGIPLAMDNCRGTLELGSGISYTDTMQVTSNQCANSVIERRFTATDSCGNSISSVQRVNISPDCPEPTTCPEPTECPQVCSTSSSIPPSRTVSLSISS